MNSNNESLVFMTVFTVLIIGFVFAFVKTGPARFGTALVLFIVTVIGWTLLKQKVDREDFIAEQEGIAQYNRNRSELIRREGEEERAAFDRYEQARAAANRRDAFGNRVGPATRTIGPRVPISAATPVLLLTGPRSIPRSAPTAAEQNAEIARKYGAAR